MDYPFGRTANNTRIENAEDILAGLWSFVIQPRTLWILGVSYLLLVRGLRYRRLSKLQSRFPTRESLAKMGIVEAQEIVISIGQLEMPYFQKLGLSFALFRTYGIPSISSLLAETSVFSKSATAAKRYVDTVMLLGEQIGRRIRSKNWIEATSRMNCIHQRYQVAGKISDEDMLYTLALFAREPIAWIDRYDWRKLSDIERCALAIFWCNQGEAMGISWTGLTSYDAGKKWKDGLHFMEEWFEWTEEYEARHMVPADSNFELAEQTTRILLWPVPALFKQLGKQAVTALMDDRLRIAMKYPPAPQWLVSGINGILQFRAFLITHLFLPRSHLTRYTLISGEPDQDGKYFSLEWDALPYYVKPTLWNRYGLGAWIAKLRGLPVPGDEGQKYCPMGFSTPDLGPGHGKKDQKAMEDRVRLVGERGNVHFEGLTFASKY